MSYRQSSFDPYAYEHPGPPMRPFNWVQWLGVVLAMGGLAINIVYLAGFFDWMPRLLDGISPALALLLAGVILINSRRAPATLVGSEQLRENRKILFIIVALTAAILGFAAALDLLGA